MDDAAAATDDLRVLHAAHAGPIHAFALQATGDVQAAEEIVQDTFVHAWRAIDRFDPQRGDMRTWLFAIARNLVVDHYRRGKARPSTPVPNERLDQPDRAVSDIDRAMEVWQVAAALHQLSPEHRAAITEIHLRGLSVAEAAEHLGIPAGTVKSRVYYGLRALRLVLEESGGVR
jgi:RNA polymerase sigma-70 factor, ECF subfamily